MLGKHLNFESKCTHVDRHCCLLLVVLKVNHNDVRHPEYPGGVYILSLFCFFPNLSVLTENREVGWEEGTQTADNNKNE